MEDDVGDIGGRRSVMTRLRRIWPWTIPLVMLGLLIGWFGWLHYVEKRVFALIRGDRDVHIQSFRISGQQRNVVCEEPRLVELFENAIRGAPFVGMGAGGGHSYSLTVVMACGGSYRIPIEVAEDDIVLSVPKLAPPGCAMELGFTTHRLELGEPIPENVQIILTFLAASFEELDDIDTLHDELGDKRLTFEIKRWGQ